MLYAAHQPDLLPYSGFFYKLDRADIFDLKIYDQYVNRGYQRRVTMREKWATIPLEPGSSYDAIWDKRVAPQAPQVLADTILDRYARKAGSGGGKAKFWDLDGRGERVVDTVLSIKTDRLWQFNLELILLLRGMLGIRTPIGLGQPVTDGLRGSEGLISAMLAYPRPLTYLSGTGARAYMGDCAEFTAKDIPVIWSAHEHASEDSVLTVLFDYEDPMSVVLREKPSQEEGSL